MHLYPDFVDLLAAFEGEAVRYLIVGGYAVAFHSRPRFTKDIDLWLEPGPDNGARVLRALEAFGAPRAAREALEAASADDIVWMGTPPVRVDMLLSLPGVPDFAEAWGRRVDTEWSGVRARLLGRADLLRAKLASTRPQDILDAAGLGEGPSGD